MADNDIEKKTKEQYLPDIIEKTRAARIKTEKRLLELDALLKHATIFYACITALLSILPLFIDRTHASCLNRISFLSIASAFIITTCTIYASGQSYAVRAEQVKHAYLELQRLWFRLDNDVHPQSVGPIDVDTIGERYIDIVASTENHSDEDWIFSKEGKATKLQQACKLLRYVFLRLMVYVGAPVILVFISFIWIS